MTLGGKHQGHPLGSDFAPGLMAQVHTLEGPGLINSGLGCLGPAGKPGCPHWIRTRFLGLDWTSGLMRELAPGGRDEGRERLKEAGGGG